MNKKLTTADRFPLGGVSYIAPQTTVADIHNEGVLCVSKNTLQQNSFGHEEWEEKTLNW